MTIGLKGGKELEQFLRSLPDKLARNVVRGGMRAGAKVIANEAKALVPVQSGLTRKSIGISTGTKGGIITAKVRTKGPSAWKAPFIEYGTAAHWISVEGYAQPGGGAGVGKKKVSVRTLNRAAAITAEASGQAKELVIAGKFVGQSVMHPGSRAHPFMRPALDNKAQEAVTAAANYIKARFTKEGLNSPDFGIDDEDDG